MVQVLRIFIEELQANVFGLAESNMPFFKRIHHALQFFVVLSPLGGLLAKKRCILKWSPTDRSHLFMASHELYACACLSACLPICM